MEDLLANNAKTHDPLFLKDEANAAPEKKLQMHLVVDRAS